MNAPQCYIICTLTVLLKTALLLQYMIIKINIGMKHWDENSAKYI